MTPGAAVRADRRRVRAVRGAIAAALLLVAVPASAQLYRWVDGEGVVRFTNDLATIPPAFRSRAEDIGSPQARPPDAGAVPDASPAPGGPTPHVMTFSAGAPIYTSVLVNGVPLNLKLDTGADRTLITPSALARAGIDATVGPVVTIAGVTGRAQAREVIVPRMDLAGTALGPLTVIAYEMARRPGDDGLLGRDVLDAFTLQVDAAAGRAVLTPRF